MAGTVAGRRTTGLAAPVKALRERFRGRLVEPGDADYDASRLLWNGAVDQRPALIARCAGVADVTNAVDFARNHHLLLAVRGGGHHVAGFGGCDGGLVLDLSPMKGVRVDPIARRARCEGGVLWGELDEETEVFGLATTGGLVSTTGVAGSTLGGGIGWLVRKHGLACDNLVAADVVTADGRMLHTNDQRHPDLLWALRGGGGNFGVATSLEYVLHPVGPVLGGLVLYAAADGQGVLERYAELAADAPRELTTLLALQPVPALPGVPDARHGRPGLAVTMCWAGPHDAGLQALAPYRSLAEPLADRVGLRPYTELQRILDPFWPRGTLSYWTGGYLRELHGAAIAALLEQAWPERSPASEIHLHQLGGAAGAVGEMDTAFSGRGAGYAYNVLGRWLDPADAEPSIGWVRAAGAALSRHAIGEAYVNFLPREDASRVAAAYGSRKYAQLAALKARYDPGNLFRCNQNIRPAT